MTQEKTQLEKLAERIPDRYVGDNGRGMSAMDHSVATQYLLMILGPYSFEVVRELYSPTKRGGEAVLKGVVGRLTAVVDGREVRIEEYGGVENAGNDDGDGERGKKAASDALKRCAMRMGLGLHLWADTRKANHYFLNEALKKRRESGDSHRIHYGLPETLPDVGNPAESSADLPEPNEFSAELTVEQKRDRLLNLIEEQGRDLARFEEKVGAVDEIDEATLDRWIGKLTMDGMKGTAKATGAS